MAFLHTLTDTWNNIATTWAAIRMNVTDTASAADSVLLDLQTNGVSRMLVTKDGLVRSRLGTEAAPAYAFIGDIGTGIYSPAAAEISMALAGTDIVSLTATVMTVDAPLIVPIGTPAWPSISTGALHTAGINFRNDTTVSVVTASIERGRFGADGNFYWAQGLSVPFINPGVGGTQTGACLREDGTLYLSSGSDPVLNLNRNTSSGTIQNFNRQGTTVGSISVATSSTAYNTSSDYRLKDRIDPPDGYDLDAEFSRLATDLVWYSFKVEPEVKQLGWMAHEFARTVPLGVTGEKDAVDDDGKMIIQMMDQAKSIPLIVARLDMLVQQVASLTAQIAEMRGEE